MLKNVFETVFSDTALCMKWSQPRRRTPTSILAVGLADGSLAILSFDQSSAKFINKQIIEEAHGFGVQSIDFFTGKDGELILISAGQDGKVCLWILEESRVEFMPMITIKASTSWINQVLWIDSHRMIAVANGKLVEFFQQDGTKLRQTAAFPSTVTRIQYSEPMNGMLCTCYGQISVVSLTKFQVEMQLEEKGSFISLSSDPNRCVVAGGMQDAMVSVWMLSDSENPSRERTVIRKRDSKKDYDLVGLSCGGYHEKVTSVQFSQTGEALVTAGGAMVVAWVFDVKNNKVKQPQQILAVGSFGIVNKVSWRPQSQAFAACSRNGRVCLWDMAKQQFMVRRTRSDDSPLLVLNSPLQHFDLNRPEDEGFEDDDFSEVEPDSEALAAIDLEWHPTGQLLAVAYSDGRLILLRP